MDFKLFMTSRQRWEKTRRFTPNGFRVSFASEETGHWYGGPPIHKKAVCFTCRKRLRLVWSNDLADPQFPDELRIHFPKLTRLPLYYCFNCPQATTYRVPSDRTVLCMDPDGHDGGDETPYAIESEVIAELPRRQIRLTHIPSTIDGILTLEDELGFDALDEAAQKQLSRFAGKKLRSSWDLGFSQFRRFPNFGSGALGHHMSES